MSNLILTGWGSVDAAMAAAVALKALGGDAEVRRVGKRQLPVELLTFDRGEKYKAIFIIGVALDADEDLLANSLSALRQTKTDVVWISMDAMPESLDKRIRPLLKKVWVADPNDASANLVTLTESALKVKASKSLPLAFPSERSRGKLPDYRSLVSAAILSHRTSRDEFSYAKAIQTVADGLSESAWSSDLKRMAAAFRRAGNLELTGEEAQIKKLRGDIKLLGKHPDTRVLIHGESGTGKENVALLIHSWSSRRNEPFYSFSCASVSAEEIAKCLFGTEYLGPNDCEKMRTGLLERADGGTLFLDEIGELPPEAQGQLLRFIESGSFRHLGGCHETEVDVRIISATNRNLPMMVREGKFREDLFMRLNVIQLRVPSLRERPGDIEQIANDWRKGRGLSPLNKQQIEDLKTYEYPGNVRELFNLLERAVALEITDYKWLIDRHREFNAGLFDPSHAAKEGVILHDALEDAIRRHVNGVYLKYGRNASKAAQALQVSRNTLRKYVDDSEKKKRKGK